jgi:predicted SprT family Zn-dependent metalloprotease
MNDLGSDSSYLGWSGRLRTRNPERLESQNGRQDIKWSLEVKHKIMNVILYHNKVKQSNRDTDWQWTFNQYKLIEILPLPISLTGRRVQAQYDFCLPPSSEVNHSSG